MSASTLHLLAFLVPISAQPVLAQGLPELMPRDLEVDLALSALPTHLRPEAGVWILERGGYAEVRGSTNGFTCLVRRMGAVPGPFFDSMIPICYDAEGTATLFPAVLDETKLLEEGYTFEEVASRVAEGWEAGTYNLPGPGVSYMLSPVFRAMGPNGSFTYVPHVMFYGPHKTDKDVGANGDRFDWVPFVQAPGFPSAMMVIPVGEKEREAIIADGAQLIRRVEEFADPDRQ